MTSSTKANGQLTPELIKRIKDILEAQENGTTLYYTSHYYTEVLGFRFPRREISVELKNLGVIMRSVVQSRTILPSLKDILNPLHKLRS